GSCACCSSSCCSKAGSFPAKCSKSPHPAKNASSTAPRPRPLRSRTGSSASCSSRSRPACSRPDTTLSANSLMPSSSCASAAVSLMPPSSSAPAKPSRLSASASAGDGSVSWDGSVSSGPVFPLAAGSCMSEDPLRFSSCLSVSGMFTPPGHGQRRERSSIASLLLRRLSTLLLIPPDELVEELFLIGGSALLTFDKPLQHRFQLLRRLRSYWLYLALGIGGKPAIGRLETLPALDRRSNI